MGAEVLRESRGKLVVGLGISDFGSQLLQDFGKRSFLLFLWH